MTWDEMTEKANKIFKLFLETLLAKMHGQFYSTWDFHQCEAMRRFAYKSETELSLLGQFYRNIELRGEVVFWDSHPEVRDALLEAMGLTLEDYLVATGQKKYRTIDDPWGST